MMQNDTIARADARVRRTHELIRDAFMSLLIERGFDEITVQAIAERAGINRATFYRHYADKFDLADRLTDILFADINRQFREGADTSSMEIWQLMFKHVAEHATFYRAMLGKGGIPGFTERVRNSVEEQMLAQLPAMGFTETQLGMPLELVVRYTATAQVGFMQWWLENDTPFPPETAALYLFNLHVRGGVWGLGLAGPADSGGGTSG